MSISNQQKLITTGEINKLIKDLLDIKEMIGKQIGVPSGKLHNPEINDFRIISIVKLQSAIFSFACWYLLNPNLESDKFTPELKEFVKHNLKDVNAVPGFMEKFLCNAVVDNIYFAFDYLFNNLNFHKTGEKKITHGEFTKRYCPTIKVLELLSFWRNTLHNNGYSKSNEDININGVIFEFRKNEMFKYKYKQIYDPLITNLISSLKKILLEDDKFKGEDFNKILPNNYTITAE